MAIRRAAGDALSPESKRAVIGQITHYLDHLATMLYSIDEYESEHTNHHLRVACTDSFLFDFRLLYYFLLDGGTSDANRYDFLDKRAWQRPKGPKLKQMERLRDFVGKHRAHLSYERITVDRPTLEDILGARKLSAEYLGGVLLDYLDVLDDFIGALPETPESSKRAFMGAAYNARYKTEIALARRAPDPRMDVGPLRSVAARNSLGTS